MDRVLPFIFLTAMVLAAIFVWRNLKVIPNYKIEYLLESSHPISQEDLEKIDHIYQIEKLSPTSFRFCYNNLLMS